MDQRQRPEDAHRAPTPPPSSPRSNPLDEVDVLGLNCAFGPTEWPKHIRHIADTLAALVSVLPNAGLPDHGDGKTYFPLNPADFAKG